MIAAREVQYTGSWVSNWNGCNSRGGCLSLLQQRHRLVKVQYHPRPILTSSANKRDGMSHVSICGEKGQEEMALCRRDMVRLGVAMVGCGTVGVQQAQALPGFKKDLTNKRRNRNVIPEDAFLDGPDGLKYYDVIKGNGAEAMLGSRVTVHFDLKWRGITFVTSRQGMGVTGGEPLGFDVGSAPGRGGTLKGLDLAVRGMKVNGQRSCIVPPTLAYGSKGYGEIPPNATLTLDVQLLSIKQSATGTPVKLVEG